MAYDNKSEVREELAMLDRNNRGDKISVVKITDESKDKVSYDIRNMYTTDDDEVRFTQKGVRLSDELTVEVVGAILKSLDEDKRQDLLLLINE